MLVIRRKKEKNAVAEYNNRTWLVKLKIKEFSFGWKIQTDVFDIGDDRDESPWDGREATLNMMESL